MKALVVGQHNPIVSESVEIVGKESVTFATEVGAVIAQLRELADKAAAAGADTLLLQNTPVIVSLAMVEMATTTMGMSQGGATGLSLPVKVAGIVSRQGARLGDKELSFNVGSLDPDRLGRINEDEIKAAIIAANGNAKVSFSQELNGDVVCHVAVAQAAKFEFDKIVIFG